MSTRSIIGLLNADQSVTYIYCHWDGYPSNNGQLLIDHYTDFQKIQSLLKLGSLSVLAPEIGEKHPFETYSLPEAEKEKYADWCTAYGRDRGEKDVEAERVETIDAFKEAFTESWAEYAYLFEDGRWYVYWDGSGFFDCSLPDKPHDFVAVEAVLREEKAREVAA